jgi:hypothetical protein
VPETPEELRAEIDRLTAALAAVEAQRDRANNDRGVLIQTQRALTARATTAEAERDENRRKWLDADEGYVGKHRDWLATLQRAEAAEARAERYQEALLTLRTAGQNEEAVNGFWIVDLVDAALAGGPEAEREGAE